MVAPATQDLVTNLLLDLAAAERQVEVVRVTLAELPDFEPFAAFRRVDQFRSGFITATDVSRFLNDLNVSAAPDEVLTVVKRMDSQGSGRVSYTDFLRAVLPSRQTLRAMASGRVSYADVAIPYEVEYALARFFTRLVEVNRSAEPGKQQLALQSKASPAQIFALLDPLHVGSLSFEAVRKYFVDRGHDNCDEDAEAVVRRLDWDGDGAVSYSEFLEGITPLEPYYKISARKSEAPLSFSQRDTLSHSQPLRKSSRSTLPTHQSLHSTTKRPPQDSTELVTVLRQQLALDRELEESIEVLALRVDFSLQGVFRFFDVQDRGSVGTEDLELAAKKLGVYPSAEELYLWLRTYCGNYEVRADYHKVCQRFTPLREEYARVLLNRQSTDTMSLETQNLLGKTLQQQIAVAVAEETLRKGLKHRSGFVPYEAFECLDHGSKGYITVDDFRKFLQAQSISPTERDMTALMTRYDRDGDAKVTYSEFLQEVTPKSEQT